MKRIFVLFSVIFLLLNSGCAGNDNSPSASSGANPVSRTEFMMGTVVTVKIYDENKEDVLEPVFERIKTLEKMITVNEDESASEIQQINAHAGIGPVEVSDEVYTLIEAGKSYSERTEGSFDITIGPLTSLWRIGFPDARKPSQQEIEQVLPLIEYKNIELNPEKRTVFLRRKGMQLDLGAIAKGYITDEVVKVLKKHDVTSAIVNLGGNVYVLGKNTEGDGWTVGIQDPFAPRGDIIGITTLSDKSVVTSGIYERFLEVDNVKYHHLLNPKDGYPYNNELAGVTVITDQSIDGDALSTSLFSKGLEEGLEFVEDFAGVEAIFVTRDKQVFITSGLKNNFELTKSGFSLAN